MKQVTLTKEVTLTKTVEVPNDYDGDDVIDLEQSNEEGWEVVGSPEDHTLEVVGEE